MADYIVTSGELTTVANAIRAKNGTSSNLSWPDGFVSGISSGSGGGGSSDFSTAEVTFSSTEFQTDFNAIYIDEEDLLASQSVVFGGRTGEKTFNLVLYKGRQMVILPENKTATVNGSATVEEYYILVTGDCTITIS